MLFHAVSEPGQRPATQEHAKEMLFGFRREHLPPCCFFKINSRPDAQFCLSLKVLERVFH